MGQNLVLPYYKSYKCWPQVGAGKELISKCRFKGKTKRKITFPIFPHKESALIQYFTSVRYFGNLMILSFMEM